MGESFKKLINNSMIFAIGTLGSKLILFILVPIYTKYLSVSEYGLTDLIVTTVNMLLPIFSLSVYDGLLRFVMDEDESNEKVLTNSLLIALLGTILLLLISPLFSIFKVSSSNILFLILLLFFQLLQRIFAQFLRATGEVKRYAINGIVLAVLTGIFSLYFLIVPRLGIKGYFLGIILANIFSIIELLWVINVKDKISLKFIDKMMIKKLLYYSMPLIPNSLMWWFVNTSNRYFIGFWVGVAANGLFAVASKIPAIISMISQVFQQAWQLSAIEEYDNKDSSSFYSKTFNSLSEILFIGNSILLVSLKPIFSQLFSEDYYSAWKIVPFLMLGVTFSSFSSFLGANYLASKKTSGVFKTSVYGGIASIILNFLLIKPFGLIGAGLSSMISFFLMFLMRYIDTRNVIKIAINYKVLLLNLFEIFLQTYILFVNFSPMLELIIETIIFVCVLVTNKNVISKVFMMTKMLINKH